MTDSSTKPNTMASEQLNHLHFVLIPLLSPGHLIPMIDMARILALHGVTVTVITTPLNAINLASTIKRAVESGLKIQLLQLRFPANEAGLPEGCENVSLLASRESLRNFFNAFNMLQEPFEQVFETLKPRPSCIISGKNVPWTVDSARKFGVPRVLFDGMGCFASSCTHKLEVSKVHENLSKFEPFLVPDLPHRVELTRAKLPESLVPGSQDLKDVRERNRANDFIADGILVNTFEELETEYVEEYRKVKGGRVWCIGPVSACNKFDLEKAERGEKASINEKKCLEWLELWEPGSVVYACLGSISGLTTWQLAELGLGLEASNQPFIWVVREDKRSEEFEKWIAEEDFEGRTEGRGIVIRGWAPQVLILSHKAIGCFLSHCGWNSTLESVSAGVPMVTCPLFAEQFLNEKLVVEVLGIGTSADVDAAVTWGLEENFGIVMKREQVKEAIGKAMDKGEEGEERRKGAREIGDKAKRAIEEGGSSYINMETFIHYIWQTANANSKKSISKMDMN